MSSLDELLNARPTKAVWHEVCLFLAELDEAELAAVAPRVLAWPAQQRPMPDDWWAQWTAGDRRPHHRLAGSRHLGTLDLAAAGRVESDSEIPDEDEGASFYHGATAVAAPANLSWLALGANAEWHHNGGDIVGWNTLRSARLTWFLSGSDYHDSPDDMQVSPDGRTVVTSVEGRWYAWSAEAGDRLWVLPEGSGPGDDDCDEDDYEDDYEDEDEEEEEDDYPDVVRIGFSGDSRRVAFGTTKSGKVAVIESATGRVVLEIPTDQKAFGPVALNANGRLLAHATPNGQVVLREVDGGTMLATTRTGLTEVHALTFAPDGTALFAVGGTAVRRGIRADPAARLLSLDPSQHHLARTVGELVRPTGLSGELDELGAQFSTRAAWTVRGPVAFVETTDGSALFDSAGRTLWADPRHQIVSFTPDGQALVTVGESINAWFLAGLAASA